MNTYASRQYPGVIRSQNANAEPVRIIVFGATGAGKTTFVNDASRANLEVGHGLASQTKQVQPSPVFRVGSRDVVLYDTPGFDDSNLTDIEVLGRITEYLEQMRQQGQRVTSLLYLHRITDNRFTGSAVRSFDMFTKICGLHNMRNAAICLNMWSPDSEQDEVNRDRQLRDTFFRDAIAHGAKVARRAGPGAVSAKSIVHILLNQRPIELQIQDELARGLQLYETQAGIAVDRNLRAKLERAERERFELEEELEQARQDRDRLAQDQLERYRRDRAEEERQLRELLSRLQEYRAGPSPPSRPTHQQSWHPTGFNDGDDWLNVEIERREHVWDPNPAGESRRSRSNTPPEGRQSNVPMSSKIRGIFSKQPRSAGRE